MASVIHESPSRTLWILLQDGFSPSNSIYNMTNFTRRYKKIPKDTERYRKMTKYTANWAETVAEKAQETKQVFGTKKYWCGRKTRMRAETINYCIYFLLCLKVNEKPLKAAADLRDFVAVAWSHEILFSSLHGRSKPHTRAVITCDCIQNSVHTTPPATMFHLSCDLWHVSDWLWQLSHCTRAAQLCDKMQIYANACDKIKLVWSV